MNRIASKSSLDAKVLRQLIAKTSAESLSENDLIRRPQSPLSPSRFNSGDCKVTQVICDTSMASLNIYIVWSINLQMWVLENWLSTPETWARDTGNRCLRALPAGNTFVADTIEPYNFHANITYLQNVLQQIPSLILHIFWVYTLRHQFLFIGLKKLGSTT